MTKDEEQQLIRRAYLGGVFWLGDKLTDIGGIRNLTQQEADRILGEIEELCISVKQHEARLAAKRVRPVRRRVGP